MSAQLAASGVSPREAFTDHSLDHTTPSGSIISKRMLKAVAIDTVLKMFAEMQESQRAEFLAQQWAMPRKWLERQVKSLIAEALPGKAERGLRDVFSSPVFSQKETCESTPQARECMSFCSSLIQLQVLKKLSGFEGLWLPQKTTYSSVRREEVADREGFEDFSQSVDCAAGRLVVVADGHKDKQILARMAVSLFCEIFIQKARKACEGQLDWQALLQEVFVEVRSKVDAFIEPYWQQFEKQELLREDRPKVMGGTTLLVTLLTYEAEAFCLCLGDSPAWIVRLTEQGACCLPLALIKTFASSKEYAGLLKLEKGVLSEWTQERLDQFPAQLGTSPYVECEAGAYSNVSRSLGDRVLSHLTQGAFPLVVPTVSFYKGLRRGDLIVCGSDGINLTSPEIETACNAVFEASSALDEEAVAEELRQRALSKPRHFLSDEIIAKLPSLRDFQLNRKLWAQKCAEIMLKWEEEELAKALEGYSGPFLMAENFADEAQWYEHCIEALCQGKETDRIRGLLEEMASLVEKEAPKTEAEIREIMMIFLEREDAQETLSSLASSFCYPETSKTWKRDLQGQLVRFIEEGCHRDNLTLWVNRVL